MRRKPKTRLLSMDECQHRPCEVNGRPAFFHRWVEEYALEALVEYLDGTIAMVKPESVRFTDRPPKP